MDFHYKKILKFNTSDLIEEFSKKYKHIKVCPNYMSMNTVKNLANTIVTLMVALEFGSLGTQ